MPGRAVKDKAKRDYSSYKGNLGLAEPNLIQLPGFVQVVATGATASIHWLPVPLGQLRT